MQSVTINQTKPKKEMNEKKKEVKNEFHKLYRYNIVKSSQQVLPHRRKK